MKRGVAARSLRGACLSGLAFCALDTGAAGSAGEEARACPPEMVLVAGAFCIDQFEATTALVHDDGSTEPHSPFLPVTGEQVRAVSKRGVVPQAYINRDEADQACREAGKRLCTDEEWLTA